MTSRWYPDFQMRLFRNIPSLMEFPNKLHSTLDIAGEPRYLADAWILHWDLVWRDRVTREAKIEEYRLAGSNPLPDYYLYEEQRFETQPSDYQPITLGFAETAPKSVESHNVYDVAVEPLDLPFSLRTDEDRALTVAITNRSTRTLQPRSNRLRPDLVLLSYHWFSLANDAAPEHAVAWDNQRHALPTRIEPGETAWCLLPVRAPAETGEFLLQFDLVEEGVAWFSQFYPSGKHRVRIER